jgi:DNA-binding protein HU-beta
MNKAELVDVIAKKTGGSKRSAGDMVDAFIETAEGALRKGGSVTLIGFGTFSTGKRGARTGRNPRTGEAIKIPARKVVKFSAGAGLKKAVNKK